MVPQENPLTWPYVFEKALETMSVPDYWRTQIVTPNHNWGNKSLITNYRPIVLSSCWLEHILDKATNVFWEGNSILSGKQYGFRRRWYSTWELVEFTHDLSSYLNNTTPKTRTKKQPTRTDYAGSLFFCVVLFRDVKPTGPRDLHVEFHLSISRILAAKDIRQRASPKSTNKTLNLKMVACIGCYLTKRKQFVEFNYTPLSVNSGVFRESVLGPVLVLVLRNDLVKNIAGQIKFYADACVLSSEMKSPEDQQELNCELITVDCILVRKVANVIDLGDVRCNEWPVNEGHWQTITVPTIDTSHK